MFTRVKQYDTQQMEIDAMSTQPIKMRRRRVLGATAAGVAVGTAGTLVRAVPAAAITLGPISRVAGRSDAEPFSGDGQPAVQAGLGETTAIAVDQEGRIFVAEQVIGSNPHDVRGIIRQVDGAGRISRVAGTGQPCYTLATNGWTRNGSMTQGRATTLILSSVGGLTLADSAVYATLNDARGGAVIRIGTTDNSVTHVAGGGAEAADGVAATDALLSGVAGLAVLANGDVLVAEYGGNRVRRIRGGRIDTFAGGNELPRVPAMNPLKPGAYTFSWDSVGDGGLARQAVLLGPRDLAVGPDGAVYVSEANGHRIRRINAAGTITTVAGTGRAGFAGDGGSATDAQLHSPHGLAFSAAGDLFIGDALNHRVRVVSGGVITTIAGTGQRGDAGDGGPAASASMTRPSMLAIAPDGHRLFVCDEGNRAVRQIVLV
jgi:hypothetical protein